jgi:hypothetical protein
VLLLQLCCCSPWHSCTCSWQNSSLLRLTAVFFSCNALLLPLLLLVQGFLVVVPDYFKGNPRTKNDSMETFPAW